MNQEPFVQVPYSLLFDKRLSCGARILYGAMLTLGHTTGECFPSHNWLAAKTGLSRISVIRYLKKLEQTGYITINRGGKHKVNHYTLHVLVCGAKRECQIDTTDVPKRYLEGYQKDTLIYMGSIKNPPTPRKREGNFYREIEEEEITEYPELKTKPFRV